MKFFAAFSALFAVASANPFAPKSVDSANAAYINQLVRGAKPTANSQLRRLDQGDYQVDISGYSVKFQQCQFVKSYDDELAQTDGSTTVLGTKRFVLFRLCPQGSCTSCNYNYGEYLVDLDTYLQSTVQYFQNYQEQMCNTCNANCYNDDAAAAQNNGGRKLQDNYNYNVDCNACVSECEKIQNMENNGYVDATDFMECQMIYGPEDDSVAPLYAGPICASGGSKIKIGVFTDENCLFADNTKDVDDYLQNDNGNQISLSHALLKMTYLDTCISCTEPQNNNNNGNDNQDGDKVIELCETLYDASAKCESTHGFESGYASYYGYENQLAQESTVCDFMKSLKSGTYDEEGEIIVSGSASSIAGGASTTGGQKFALCFFILGTVGLAVYAGVLHSKLTKGSKATLGSSGGALA